MRQYFKNCACPITTPPVTFYCGDIINDNGEFKLEWNNDPDKGYSLLTEEDLTAKEKSSRIALNPTGDRDEWLKQRNINYSAEYGLARLQEFKKKNNINLKLPYSPVVK